MRVSTLEHALEEKEGVLEGSQKEASEAKQQVLEICTKMKAGKVEGEKGKCAENGAGGGSKRRRRTNERCRVQSCSDGVQQRLWFCEEGKRQGCTKSTFDAFFAWSVCGRYHPDFDMGK